MKEAMLIFSLQLTIRRACLEPVLGLTVVIQARWLTEQGRESLELSEDALPSLGPPFLPGPGGLSAWIP